MQIFVKPLQIIFLTDIKFSKTHLLKMIQSGGFLGGLLDQLQKMELRLIKNVTKPLTKNVLIPLGLIEAASAADVGLHKKILGWGHNHSLSTTLMISNNKIEDIIKTVKSPEYSGVLLKGITETVQNEVK